MTTDIDYELAFEYNKVRAASGIVSHRPITKAAFSATGNLLFVAGKCGNLVCYSVTTDPLQLTKVRVFSRDTVDKPVIKDFAVSDCSDLLFYVDNNTLFAKGVFSEESAHLVFAKDFPRSVCFSSRKDRFEAVTAHRHSVVVRPFSRDTFEFGDSVYTLALPGETVQAAVVQDSLFVSEKTGRLVLASLEKPVQTNSLQLPAVEIRELTPVHGFPLVALSASDRKVRLVASKDSQLQVLQEYKTEFPVNSAVVDVDRNLLFCTGSQRAETVAFQGADKSFDVLAFDLRTTDPLFKLKLKVFSPVNSLALSPHSSLLAAGLESGMLSVVEVVQGCVAKSEWLDCMYKNVLLN